jgi:hypothetical protein
MLQFCTTMIYNRFKYKNLKDLVLFFSWKKSECSFMPNNQDNCTCRSWLTNQHLPHRWRDKKEGGLTGTNRQVMAIGLCIPVVFLDFRSMRRKTVCTRPYDCTSCFPEWSWAPGLLVHRTWRWYVGGSRREPKVRLKLMVEAREIFMAGGECPIACCLHNWWVSKVLSTMFLWFSTFCTLKSNRLIQVFDRVLTSLLW